jgi:hypothetical protein
MSAEITIVLAVPLGHRPGDYARLHGNGGSGGIDYDVPIDNRYYDLFPNGAGLYGFGHAPFGHHRFGHAYTKLTNGFGHLPFGHFPFGHNTGKVAASVHVDYCGFYKFTLVCYDQYDNLNTGTPQEVSVNIHTKPPSPTGLEKNSYSPNPNHYTVEGSLVPDATGEYYDAGIYNGKTFYRNAAGTWFIWWDNIFTGWGISTELGSHSEPHWFRDFVDIEGVYYPQTGATGTATIALTIKNSLLILDVA